MVEVVHQVVGQELLLAQVGLHVGLDAKQYVVAKLCPRIVARHLVYHLAVGRRVAFTLGILHLATDALLDDVAGLRGTIIIKIVIAIDAVLRLEVLAQSLPQACLLLTGQVQDLLCDHAAKMAVFP